MIWSFNLDRQVSGPDGCGIVVVEDRGAAELLVMHSRDNFFSLQRSDPETTLDPKIIHSYKIAACN